MLIFESYVYCQVYLEAKCLEIVSVHLEFAFFFKTSLLDTRERGSYILQDKQTSMVPFII